MQRFVLTENIQRFRQRLAESPDSESRAVLQRLVGDMERELALLEAANRGVRPRGDVLSPEQAAAARDEVAAWFRKTFADDPRLAALYDPDPGLVIEEVNPTFAAATGMTRDQIVGKPLFELFPDNPGDPAADGVRNLFASLRKVAETGEPDVMALQRYDVRDEQSVWRTRYWRPVNTPLKNDRGRLVSILHLVEEATP